MVRRVLLPLIVLVAATTLAAAVAAAPQTKTARPAKGRPMQALAHLPTDSDTVILIPDPLPHLKALLTSQPLRRVMTEGRFAEILKRSPSKITSLDPVQAWDFIDQHRRFVPREMALAVTSQSWADFDHLARSVMLAMLCKGVQETGGAGAGPDLQGLQKQLLVQLKSVRVPRLVVWVEFREAETAAQVLELVRPSVEALAREGKFQLTEQDGALGVRGKLGDVVDPVYAKALLVEFGAVAGFDDPMAGALAEALRGIPLEVWLERIDSGLRLATGPRPETTAEHLTAEQLGPVYWMGPEALFFVHWDLGRLRQASQGLLGVWDKWKDTPAGRWVAENDDEDLLGSLKYFARELEGAGERGAMLWWVEPGAIRGLTIDEGVSPADDLRDSPIIKLVPGDAKCVWLSNVTSLADLVAGWLSHFEGRLSTQSLRAEIKSDELKGRIAEVVTEHYYRDFARFRTLIYERFPQVVGPPTAMLVTTEGTVKRFMLSGHGIGLGLPIAVENMPIVEVALIGRAQDADATRRFFGDLHRALAEGVFAAAGKPVPEDLKPLREEPLVPGVPAYFFDGAWIPLLAGDGKLKISLEGDFQPHFFFNDGFLVFSTSAKLSRRILRARGEGARPCLAPLDRTNRIPVAYGCVPGETVGETYVFLFRWIGAIFEEIFGVPWSGQSGVAGMLPDLGVGLGELVHLVDRAEWLCADKGNQRRTDWRIKFNTNYRP